MRRIAPRGNRTEDRGSRSSHKVLLKRKRPLQVEVARGKAGGLYIDQKVIMTGSLDSLSEKELEAKLKQILEDHKNIINISSEDTEEISKERLASYEESK
jgi:hypothetical protein